VQEAVIGIQTKLYKNAKEAAEALQIPRQAATIHWRLKRDFQVENRVPGPATDPHTNPRGSSRGVDEILRLRRPTFEQEDCRGQGQSNVRKGSYVLQNARVYANNSICIQSHCSKCKPFTCFKMPEYTALTIQFAFSHVAQNASLSRDSKCVSLRTSKCQGICLKFINLHSVTPLKMQVFHMLQKWTTRRNCPPSDGS
jgi:hypothetical protein